MSSVQQAISACEALKTQLEAIAGKDLHIAVLIDGVPVDMIGNAKEVSSNRGTFKSLEVNEPESPFHISFLSEYVKK